MTGINPYTIDGNQPPDPGFHALTGDVSDDDGQAIDDYFRAGYQGPVSSESVQYEALTIPKPDRMIISDYFLGVTPNGSVPPIQVAVQDVARSKMMITVTASTNAVDNPARRIYYSSEKMIIDPDTLVYLRNTAFLPIVTANTVLTMWHLDLGDYTGPLWLYSTVILADTRAVITQISR